jgi:hypothetical protein
MCYVRNSAFHITIYTLLDVLRLMMQAAVSGDSIELDLQSAFRFFETYQVDPHRIHNTVY